MARSSNAPSEAPARRASTGSSYPRSSVVNAPKKQPRQAKSKPADAAATGRNAGTGRALAQMRLQPGDAETLQKVQTVFGLDTIADVLREGLRRLAIEADEIQAAASIRAYYGDDSAPLPDGVVALTDEELAEADAEIERGIAEGRW